MGIFRKMVQLLANLFEPKTGKGLPASGGIAYGDVIRKHQEQVRHLNDLLNDQIDKIKGIEAGLKRFFELYDQASPAERKIYAVRIRGLNGDMKTQSELRDSYEAKLKQENVIIAKLQLNQVNSDMQLNQEEADHIIEDALEVARENEMSSDKIEMMNKIQYHKQPRKRRENSEKEEFENDSISDIRAQIELSEDRAETTKAEVDGDFDDIEEIRKQSSLL